MKRAMPYIRRAIVAGLLNLLVCLIFGGLASAGLLNDEQLGQVLFAAAVCAGVFVLFGGR